MDLPSLTSLPIARYRFTAVVQQPLALPDYAGSLLRGQFGAALRQVACMTRQPTCTGCPLLQTCPYTRIFEAPPPEKGRHALQDFSQIPNPYVMEPPPHGARLLAEGDELVFHLVLVGHAIDQLALIIFALQRALAQGLTRQRVPAELVRIDCMTADNPPQSGGPVWLQEHPLLAEHATTQYVPPAPASMKHLALHIHTPLRLQQQGRPLGVGQLTPRALVAAVARRTALLLEFHAGHSGWGEAARDVTRQAESLTDQRDLHWHDWTRYSSRQRQEMTLGGVIGTWTLHGNADTLASIWSWLWLGQWLHVGKNATMGMGSYMLEPVIGS
ncbi:MAG: CRISPR system precrRNA processing endoribonuclease RAMP protein Cas6 [Polaromonas sp.]